MPLHDQYGRPYTRSPLMAQYFAGHMQMHYKRIAMAYVVLVVAVLIVAGATIPTGQWKQYTPTWLGGTAGQYPNSEPTRDGYYVKPTGEPDVYPSRLPDLTFPAPPPAAVVAPTTTANAFYPCTPGSRNCS